LNSITFITEKYTKDENDNHKLIGVIKNGLFQKSQEVDIFSYGGRTYRGTVLDIDYTTDKDVKDVADEKTCYITIEYEDESITPSQFDVITPIIIQFEDKEGRKQLDNRRLEALLERFRYLKREALMGAVFEEISMNAKFYVVASKTEKGLAFPTLSGSGKKKYYAAFTSSEDLAKAPKLAQSVVVTMAFEEILNLFHTDVLANGLIINPFSSNLTIDRKTLGFLKTQRTNLLSGLHQEKPEKTERVIISDPDKLPDGLIRALKLYSETDNGVSKLWLRKIVREESKRESLLLVVKLNGELTRTFSGLMATAKPYVNGFMRFEMIPDTEPVAKDCIEGAKPIFSR